MKRVRGAKGSAGDRTLAGPGRKSNMFTPGLGHQYKTKEVSIDDGQASALRHLYETDATVVAAKNILESRLFGSGLALKRKGKTIDLTPEFRQHLNDVWISFAKQVLAGFLTVGFAVVSYEQEARDCATTRRRRRLTRTSLSEASGTGGKLRASAQVPVAVTYGLCRVAFEQVGESGYQRCYHVYRHDLGDTLEADEDSVLHIHDEPDARGNLNSSMVPIHAFSVFCQGLIHEAAIAERSRTRPPLVTQQRKSDSKNGVGPADMFFDTESRGISREQTEENNAAAARALQMQIKLCEMLNRSVGGGGGGGGAGASASSTPGANSELTNRIFALPADHEMASHAPVAQARPDLETLLRYDLDIKCTALGVPSTLLSEGRYASQTGSQLAILNSTVNRLATAIDRVLTDTYIDIYGEGGEGGEGANEQASFGGAAGAAGAATDAKFATGDGAAVELVTLTSPLASTNEVISLVQGGLADVLVAAPLALHALGLNQVEIDEFLKRHAADEAERKKCLDEDRVMAQESQKTALETQKRAFSEGLGGNEGGAPPSSSSSSTATGGGGGGVGGGSASGSSVA